MKHTTLFIFLSAATLSTSSAIALEQAIGTLNNKAEYYAREIQMNQLEAAADRLQQQSDDLSSRLQETENCAQQGGAYDVSTSSCLQYIVTQKNGRHTLIPSPTSSTRTSRLSAANLTSFKSSNRVTITINMTCSYGGGSTWTITTLDPNTAFNQEHLLCYQSSNMFRPSRHGYARLQYNPSNATFTVTPRFIKNSGQVNSGTVDFSYAVVETSAL